MLKHTQRIRRIVCVFDHFVGLASKGLLNLHMQHNTIENQLHNINGYCLVLPVTFTFISNPWLVNAISISV